jgi:hypothetical protein
MEGNQNCKIMNKGKVAGKSAWFATMMNQITHLKCA